MRGEGDRDLLPLRKSLGYMFSSEFITIMGGDAIADSIGVFMALRPVSQGFFREGIIFERVVLRLSTSLKECVGLVGLIVSNFCWGILTTVEEPFLWEKML